MLLIFGDEAQWEAMTPEQAEANEAGHVAFRAAAGSKIGGGEELEATSMATKEALGGFYLIEASGLAEAAKLASLLPELQTGHCGVEIRPVVDPG